MTVLEIIKSTIDAMFPLEGATLDWDQHKAINAAIIDAVVTYDSPAGVIIPIESDTAPDGYHFFNNGVLQIADCPKLYAIWGTRFNIGGEANGTFRCPRYAVGTTLVQAGVSGYNDIDLTLFASGGEMKHQLSLNEMPRHSHKVPFDLHGSIGSAQSFASNQGISATYADIPTMVAGNDESHNNMQPYRAVNFMFRLC